MASSKIVSNGDGDKRERELERASAPMGVSGATNDDDDDEADDDEAERDDGKEDKRRGER